MERQNHKIRKRSTISKKHLLDSEELAELIKLSSEATSEAFLSSRKSKSYVLYIEDNKLYEIDSTGKKTVLKNIPKHNKQIPKTFKIG